jgi:hypothetical protein
MGIARDYLKGMILDTLDVVNSVGENVERLDNSNLEILERDYNNIKNVEMHKENIKQLLGDIGFFKAISERSSAVSFNNNLTCINRRLSSKELYMETIELGLDIMKNNFENKEDIEKFNKMFKECKYYENKFRAL